MASICSVTFIDANSAPMPAPTRPLTTRPVMMGPVSWITEKTMAAGSSDLAPNRVRLYRASMESTIPVAAPARATSGKDFDPISSSCRNNSRNSNGGVTAACTTCQKNIPRSPNHSRNWLMGPLEELTVGDGTEIPGPERRGSKPATATDCRSIMGLNPDLALRARLGGASGVVRSGVRHRGTRGRHLRPHIPEECSYPFGAHP